jgi:hypothetical protein
MTMSEFHLNYFQLGVFIEALPRWLPSFALHCVNVLDPYGTIIVAILESLCLQIPQMFVLIDINISGSITPPKRKAEADYSSNANTVKSTKRREGLDPRNKE